MSPTEQIHIVHNTHTQSKNESFVDDEFENESDIQSEKSVDFIEDEESVPADDRFYVDTHKRMALCEKYSSISKKDFDEIDANSYRKKPEKSLLPSP